MQLSFPVVIDEGGDVARTYGVRYTPTHFLIDRAGIVRAAGSGSHDWNGPLAHAAVRLLLAPAVGKAPTTSPPRPGEPEDPSRRGTETR